MVVLRVDASHRDPGSHPASGGVPLEVGHDVVTSGEGARRARVAQPRQRRHAPAAVQAQRVGASPPRLPHTVRPLEHGRPEPAPLERSGSTQACRSGTDDDDVRIHGSLPGDRALRPPASSVGAVTTRSPSPPRGIWRQGRWSGADWGDGRLRAGRARQGTRRRGAAQRSRPATGLDTGVVPVGVEAPLHLRLIETEIFDPDINKFHQLARADPGRPAQRGHRRRPVPQYAAPHPLCTERVRGRAARRPAHRGRRVGPRAPLAQRGRAGVRRGRGRRRAPSVRARRTRPARGSPAHRGRLRRRRARCRGPRRRSTGDVGDRAGP